jgi:hypothetical protein
MNKYIFIIFLTTLFGCGKLKEQKDNNYSSISEYNKDIKNKEKIFFNKTPNLTFRIPNELRTNGYIFHSIMDENIYLYNNELFIIKKLNIKSGNVTTLTDFAYLNLTSKAYPVIKPNEEVIIIHNNEIINLNNTSRSNENKLSLFIDNHLYGLNINNTHSPVYDQNSNAIYVSVFIDDEVLPSNFKSFPSIGKINLNTNTLELVNISYPSDYKSEVNYGFFENPMININGNNLYVSYGLSKTINILNTNTNAINNYNINTSFDLSNPVLIKDPKTPKELENLSILNTHIQSTFSTNKYRFNLIKEGAMSNDMIPDKKYNQLLIVQDINNNVIYHGNLNNEKLLEYNTLKIIDVNENKVKFLGYKEENNFGYEDIIELAY